MEENQRVKMIENGRGYNAVDVGGMIMGERERVGNWNWDVGSLFREPFFYIFARAVNGKQVEMRVFYCTILEIKSVSGLQKLPDRIIVPSSVLNIK